MENRGEGRREMRSEPEYLEDNYQPLLSGIFRAVWARRGLFLVLAGLTTALIVLVSGMLYLGQTRQNIAEVTFKLMFEGIEKNQYPNELPFTPEDIVAPIILEKVYRENGIDRYMDFPSFQSAVSVIRRNDRLVFLEMEYSERLSARNLTAPERARLEEEYSRKKAGLMTPVFKLEFVYPGRITAIPRDLQLKVLKDILNSWSDYLITVKGVDRYQIDIVSANILDLETIRSVDYFVAGDIIRRGIGQINSTIRKLEELPGSALIRVGEKRISLSDVRYRMRELESFRLSPLPNLISRAGLSKDPRETSAYFDSRLFKISLDRQKAAARQTVYREALERYLERTREVGRGPSLDPISPPAVQQEAPMRVPAIIPQFGESFLSDLIDLGQHDLDFRFRQEMTNQIAEEGLREAELSAELEYYRQLSALFQESKSAGSEDLLPYVAERIEREYGVIVSQMLEAIDELNAIYLEISQNNLSPGSDIFQVVQPMSLRVAGSLNRARLVQMAAVGWLIAILTIVLGIYLKHQAGR